MKRKCIIVDLEGTLSDCSHRIHHLMNKDYDKWNELFHLDPINSEFIKVFEENFTQITIPSIILCTAKEMRFRKDVERWLCSNKIPFSGVKRSIWGFINSIHYRKTGDTRSSVEVKADMVEGINKDYQITKAYDDRKDIRDMYNKYGIETPCWPGVKKEGLSLVSEEKTVSQILSEAGEFYEGRAAVYGEAHKKHGKIMEAFFPEGMKLKTAEDFYSWHIFELVVVKMNRIARCMMRGEEHHDSWKDTMVYSAMKLESIQNKKGVTENE